MEHSKSLLPQGGSAYPGVDSLAAGDRALRPSRPHKEVALVSVAFLVLGLHHAGARVLPGAGLGAALAGGRARAPHAPLGELAHEGVARLGLDLVIVTLVLPGPGSRSSAARHLMRLMCLKFTLFASRDGRRGVSGGANMVCKL